MPVLSFTLRDMNNEEVDVPKEDIHTLTESLNNENVDFVGVWIGNRRVYINKIDIMKVEWST